MKVYNFTHIRGDTYRGAIFTITVNNEPLDLTNATILCQFKKSASFNPALTWTELNGITIINTPLHNQFKFNSQIIDIESGNYVYDIQITLNSGDVVTYIKGNLTLVESVSHV